MSIGTIFAVCPAKDQPDASFLRPACELTAGGCIILGPRCCLMVRFGDGTQIYTLNPDTDSFNLTAPRMTMPGCFFEFAINASHYRHWPPDPRLYRRVPGGIDGPRAQNLNRRWIASLVATRIGS
ncbi:hypothetical protein [Paracoccus actinidiae]|jgi:fructose-1,6-bisphosphatase I|uniref:hypothetical protein n=1 Tax=Paracoccus actinidiae TaxID=3064531 RepID=UPI0027D2385B|nr:hypothetical protein [Paracoccus sp. M09]